jgi:hypothetical protein
MSVILKELLKKYGSIVEEYYMRENTRLLTQRKRRNFKMLT